FFSYSYVDHRDLHSFPTRRSSDLPDFDVEVQQPAHLLFRPDVHVWIAESITYEKRQHLARGLKGVEDCRSGALAEVRPKFIHPEDRKSTRLNSSHVSISYAVFCLK